ncbi:trypsin-like peptidase domain-containing protein [Pelagicoccus sp. SDUM812002]|uniref:trypsin-like peptidase domain-containing protein n=1 Tax=Pelagicoccus sp. SDUM812002 TaxID=3041266 RepID=UPI00280EABAD|nr:trypsin-like peptidase domain-containing protein [Pelagicoccus sp. SDUM812002]MDQ8186922.1 trypsin-like peptidase domain-containing protein [Pelagicoccus sp. SDUM812002]
MPHLKRAFFLVGLVLIAALPRLQAQEQVDVSSIVEIDPTPLDRTQSGRVVSYSESLKEARPAVVSVYAKSLDASLSREELLLEQLFGKRLPRPQNPQFGLGSGVIVSKSGYIITNNHVISQADEIKVQLDSQRIYDAVLVGTDPRTDIAILKIESDIVLPSIPLADSDQLEVGDVVFAIGNPLGIGKTVTMGIVSATKRQQMGVIDGGFEDFIQTDAPINSGNSGGALVDARGRLIGINTLIQTAGASTGNIGIGFAVPANLAYSVMTDLVETGAVSRGFLGVGIRGLSQEKAVELGIESLKGALVDQVNEGTPAASAGIEVEDVIVSLDGVAVDSPSDLRIRIAARKPGDSVSISLIRDSVRQELQVVLAELGEVGPVLSIVDLPATFLEGVLIVALTDDLREEYEVNEDVDGVIVIEVEEGSPYTGQLTAGMVIQSINGQDVVSYEEAAQALKPSGKNMFKLTHRGVNRWVGIEVD